MFSPGQSLHSADCVRPPTLVTPEQRTLTPRESLIARKATSLESPFTPRQAEQTLSTEEEDPDLVYFPVNLDISELHDWKQGWEDHGQKGELVRVNNTEVAVFRYGEEVVATRRGAPAPRGYRSPPRQVPVCQVSLAQVDLLCGQGRPSRAKEPG